jgi:5-methylcytosine-specific restriction endonuclease McrA
MITKKCEQCGKEFNIYPSELNKKKYCSKDCKYKALGNTLRKRIKVKCANCGKELEKQPAKVTGEHTFCNKKCMGEYYSKQKSVKCACTNCGKMFERPQWTIKDINKSFCSQECANACNNEQKKNRSIVKCATCGKELERRPSDFKDNQQNTFCNAKCRSIYMMDSMAGENNVNWKGGRDEYRGPNWLRQRRAARERDNKTCQLCGATGKDIKLVVHHIVPFRFFNNDYKTGNKIRNLITLCRHCHGLMASHDWTEVPEEFKYLLDLFGRRKIPEKNWKAEMLIRGEGKK